MVGGQAGEEKPGQAYRAYLQLASCASCVYVPLISRRSFQVDPARINRAIAIRAQPFVSIPQRDAISAMSRVTRERHS